MGFTKPSNGFENHDNAASASTAESSYDSGTRHSHENLYFTPLILLGMILSPLQARSWTSVRWHCKLEAEFISATATEVTLKRDQGRQDLYDSRCHVFLKADQAFVKEKLGQLKPSGGKPITGEYAKLISGDWELAQYKDLPYAFYGAKDLDGSQKNIPLVVVLHGKSSNNENGKQISFARRFAESGNYEKRPCLIFSPLCYQPHGATGGGWDDAPGEEALELIKDFVKELPVVDPDRVYVIGYSMGGFGTWHFLKNEPRLFARRGSRGGILPAASANCVPCRSGHFTEPRTMSSRSTVPGTAAEELKRSKVFKYTEYPGGGPRNHRPGRRRRSGPPVALRTEEDSRPGGIGDRLSITRREAP